MEREVIVKMAVGGSFILALTKEGRVFAMGENYKVQS